MAKGTSSVSFANLILPSFLIILQINMYTESFFFPNFSTHQSSIMFDQMEFSVSTIARNIISRCRNFFHFFFRKKIFYRSLYEYALFIVNGYKFLMKKKKNVYIPYCFFLHIRILNMHQLKYIRSDRFFVPQSSLFINNIFNSGRMYSNFSSNKLLSISKHIRCRSTFSLLLRFANTFFFESIS